MFYIWTFKNSKDRKESRRKLHREIYITSPSHILVPLPTVIQKLELMKVGPCVKVHQSLQGKGEKAGIAAE